MVVKYLLELLVGYIYLTWNLINEDVDNCKVINRNIFYTDYDQRTQTIYKTNLQHMKTELTKKDINMK